MSSSQSETTGALQDSIEDARYDIFVRFEQAELNSDNVLFKMSSKELSEGLQMKYRNYFKQLVLTEREMEHVEREMEHIEREREHIEREREHIEREREREREHIEREMEHEACLSELFQTLSKKLSTDDYNLAKCLPLNVLKSDSCSQDNFLSFFGAKHDKTMVIEFYTRFFNLKRNDDSKNELIDDTPSQNVKDDLLIVDKGGQTIFYPFKEIFVRKCYSELKDLALNASERSSVAIIGDPGIGKTTLIRYMFHYLVKKGIKVYWAFESGMWRYFDGSGNPKTGTEVNDSWMQNDVILLVDGSYQEKFMPKIKKMILFCSPERSNYTKMIKFHQGRVFVMPPWSFEEVEQLFNSKENECDEICGLRLFKNFYDEVVADNPENSSYEVCEFLARDKNLDENENKKKLILSWLKERYNLVGGRIRLLLDNNLRFEELRERVENAVHCVSPKKLSRINALDYISNVPSILYSLIPTDETNFRRYTILFASDAIRDIVFNSIITGKTEDFKTIFGTMKANYIAGSLMGQIFESTVHKYISQKLHAELLCRILVAPNNSKSKSSKEDKKEEKLIMSSFKTIYYDLKQSQALKETIKNTKKNLFMIPKQSNAPQVDSIYYDCAEKNIYFYQITTALRHSFKFHEISKLAKDIGFEASSVRFVFIVPESIFNTFTVQNLTTNNQPLKYQNKLHSQMVARFSDSDEINNHFVEIQASNSKIISNVIKEDDENNNLEKTDEDMREIDGEGEDDEKQPMKRIRR